MAMDTQTKLGVAVLVLAGLGGALWWQNKKQKEEAQSYTAEKRTADLPKLELSDDQIKSIDKVTLERPAGDAGKPGNVTLEKKGDTWKVTAPVNADANSSNVSSLTSNLKQLKITEEIDPTPAAYEKYGVADSKALHATFYKGTDKVVELWFGESGSRGQMTRLAGRDGVYAVKGYSSYLYEREVKDWRDRTVFKFEEDKVKAVDIVNEHGTFAFAATGAATGDAGSKTVSWSAKFKGPKDAAAKALERFDEAKVKDAIRAYKNLNADNFAEATKTAADLGLEKPTATITFTLEDGAKKTLHIGASAEGTSRWAKVEGGSELISVGSWAADWALANTDKFQKPEEKKKGDAGAASATKGASADVGGDDD
jgi:hypothetical protein